MWIANNMTKKYNDIRNKNKGLSNKKLRKEEREREYEKEWMEGLL